MMCGKCGAELFASAKFCASCGAPTAVASPVSKPSSASNRLAELPPIDPPPPSPNMLVIPDDSVPANVNPFASTASPSSRALPPMPGAPGSQPALSAVKVVPAPQSSGALEAAKPFEPKIETKKDSQPPQSSSPMSPRAVSPLAMSAGGLPGKSPFSEALAKARESVAPKPVSEGRIPVPSQKTVKKPGTYVMQNAPMRPTDKPASEPPPKSAAEEPTKKNVPKTVAMGFNPAKQILQDVTARSAGPVASPAPASVAMPPASHVSPQQQPPSRSGYPASHPQPSAPPPVYPQPPQPQQQQWGQTPNPAIHQPYQPQPLAPYQAPAAPQYPPPQWGQYGYAPGARVQVTWSNGQRYPATVGQMNGTQCLVIFPDGQQHWVDMQYLTPG